MENQRKRKWNMKWILLNIGLCRCIDVEYQLETKIENEMENGMIMGGPASHPFDPNNRDILQ